MCLVADLFYKIIFTNKPAILKMHWNSSLHTPGSDSRNLFWATSPLENMKFIAGQFEALTHMV
jgi:hypothetical protein